MHVTHSEWLWALTAVSLANLIPSLSLDLTILKLHWVFCSTASLFQPQVLCMSCSLCFALLPTGNVCLLITSLLCLPLGNLVWSVYISLIESCRISPYDFMALQTIFMPFIIWNHLISFILLVWSSHYSLSSVRAGNLPVVFTIIPQC